MNFNFEDTMSFAKSLTDTMKNLLDKIVIVQTPNGQQGGSQSAPTLGVQLLTKDKLLNAAGAAEDEDPFEGFRKQSRDLSESRDKRKKASGQVTNRRQSRSCENLSLSVEYSNENSNSLANYGEAEYSCHFDGNFRKEIFSRPRAKLLEIGYGLKNRFQQNLFSSSTEQTGMSRSHIILRRSSSCDILSQEAVSSTASISDSLSYTSERSRSDQESFGHSLQKLADDTSSISKSAASVGNDFLNREILAPERNWSVDTYCNSSAASSVDTSRPCFKTGTCSSRTNSTSLSLSKTTYSSKASSGSDSHISGISSSSGSFTKEFKHDIDYLATVTYKTSTPEVSPTFKKQTDNDRVTEHSHPCSTMSADTQNKKFVHGPSPLCKIAQFKQKTSLSADSDDCEIEDPLSRSKYLSPMQQIGKINSNIRITCDPVTDSNCALRGRVRRSLFSFSPLEVLKAFPAIARCDNTISRMSGDSPVFVKQQTDVSDTLERSPVKVQLIDTGLSASQSKPTLPKGPRPCEVEILPKYMFHDETEEAVYYLRAKYLENEHCTW